MRIYAFSFCFAVSVQGIFIQMVSKDHDYDNLIKKPHGLDPSGVDGGLDPCGFFFGQG